MRHAYIRPEAKCTEVFQRKHIKAPAKKIVAERARVRDDSYPEFRFLVDRMLQRGDELEVSHWHRLASTTDAMFEHARQVLSKGVVIVEMSTGRRSDSPVQLLEMVEEAVHFYAGRSLSKDEASRLGKLGALASPATKRRRGYMPNRQAEAILNDHARYPTLKMALAAINADKRYARRWDTNRVYREAKNPDQKERLNLLERRAGRPVWSKKYEG